MHILLAKGPSSSNGGRSFCRKTTYASDLYAPTSNSCIFTPIDNWTHVYMNLFTRNSLYHHPLKYLLFLLKHPVHVLRLRTGLCGVLIPVGEKETSFFFRTSKTSSGPYPASCSILIGVDINPLNSELNPICYLLALLGAHHFLHVSRIRVKLLTFRLIMSYIYGAPILDVSRSHTTTQHSR